MLIRELARATLEDRLKKDGLLLRLHPFTVRVRSSFPTVASGLQALYGDFPVADGEFADFHIGVARPKAFRRWFRRQSLFEFDGQRPFLPLPADQAFAMFEWGLNWCISANVEDFLIVHAATLEGPDGGVILPAPPGSGKSTLTAALCLSGWRLLSDELTLIRRGDGRLQGLARPVSLKNDSIRVISDAFPEASFSAPIHDTAKGTVVHLRPPSESVARVRDLATPRRVILPRFSLGAGTRLEHLPKGEAFMHLAENAFNYSTLGPEGFELVGDLIQRCDTWSLEYGNLDEALEALHSLIH